MRQGLVAVLATLLVAAQAGQAADQAQAPRPAKAGQELVGKWCHTGPFAPASAAGTECFQLKADGTYVHAYEGSTRQADSGRWSLQGSVLTAQSTTGKVATYALEKRNDTRDKRAPMICLNGNCFVTSDGKPPW